MRDVATRDAFGDDVETARIVAKVSRRLIPLLAAGFFVAYLDRVNIGFAALTMNREMGFTPDFYGWAAGVFFIGYCLFEAPSNYIMHRVGARIWIARIMVSWGLVAAATAFIWSETSFVALRLALGFAEAGFAPGVILYLAYWVPPAQRARILANFLLAVPVASAAGAPISGFILSAMDGVLGVSGWRWLFFVEAAPSILLGVACYFLLADSPSDAKWLSTQERDALQAAIARDSASDHANHWRALGDPRVLTLGAAYFGIVIALYGLSFWLPQIIEAFGYGLLATSILASIPYVCGAIAMWQWSRSSDKRRETVGHTALAATIGGVALACAAYAPTPHSSIIALSVAAVGAIAALPAFWSFTTQALGATDAIVGVAVINSIGNVSGLAGPYFIGLVKSATGEFSSALFVLALGPLMAALLIVKIARSGR